MEIEFTNTARGISWRLLPSNNISPDQGSYNPATNLAMVDLPEPLPPTNAIRCPGLIIQLKFSTSG